MVNRFERQPAEHPHIRQELDTIELKVCELLGILTNVLGPRRLPQILLQRHNNGVAVEEC